MQRRNSEMRTLGASSGDVQVESNGLPEKILKVYELLLQCEDFNLLQRKKQNQNIAGEIVYFL